MQFDELIDYALQQLDEDFQNTPTGLIGSNNNNNNNKMTTNHHHLYLCQSPILNTSNQKTPSSLAHLASQFGN
jgi:hypothetical protein